MKAPKADIGSQSNYVPPQGLCIYGDSLSLYFRDSQSLEGIQALAYTVTTNRAQQSSAKELCCLLPFRISACYGFGFTLIKAHINVGQTPASTVMRQSQTVYDGAAVMLNLCLYCFLVFSSSVTCIFSRKLQTTSYRMIVRNK